MRTRFRSDACWSAAATLVPMFIGAAAIPILLRTLGPEAFAVFALCLAMLSFAPSFDLGVSRTAFRRVAAASHDQTACASIADFALYHASRVGLGVAAVLLVGLSALSALAGLDDASTALPVLLSILGVPVTVVTNTQRSVMEGARLFRASAYARIAFNSLVAIVPTALSAFTDNVSALCLSAVAIRTAAAWHHATVLARYGLQRPRRHPAAALLMPHRVAPDRTFWLEGRWHALSTAVAPWMSGFDRFLIAGLTGTTLVELSVFVAPQEIALKAIILPAAILPALFVRLAEAFEDKPASASLAHRLFIFLCVPMLLACLAASVFASHVADALFGPLKAAPVSGIVQILCLGIFSNTVAQFAYAALTARGHAAGPAVLQLAELPFFVVSLPVLIATFGIAGAAWAWSGRIIIDTVALLWLARNKVPMLPVPAWHALHAGGLGALLLVALTAPGAR